MTDSRNSDLHQRYQLALRGSQALGSGEDPSDALAFWSRIVDDLAFAVVTIRELGIPLRGESRVMLIGGVGQTLDDAHKAILKLHSWTRQVHRTLAASAEPAPEQDVASSQLSVVSCQRGGLPTENFPTENCQLPEETIHALD